MTAASIINFTGKVVHYEEAKHVDTVNLLGGGGGYSRCIIIKTGIRDYQGDGGQATADTCKLASKTTEKWETRLQQMSAHRRDRLSTFTGFCLLTKAKPFACCPSCSFIVNSHQQ